MSRDDWDDIDRREEARKSPRASSADADGPSKTQGGVGAEQTKRSGPGVVVPLVRRRAETRSPGRGPDDDDPGPSAA